MSDYTHKNVSSDRIRCSRDIFPHLFREVQGSRIPCRGETNRRKSTTYRRMGSGIVAVSRCWRKHAWSDLTLLIWICILWRLGRVLVICLMLQKPIKRNIESPWKHEGRWRNSPHKTNFCAKLLQTKLETHFT